jgi:arylsulfatase A-like enzyme
MIEKNRGSKKKPELSLFWPSVFLAVALVVIKATYVKISQFWGIGDWDVPLDLFIKGTYYSWVASASQSDLLFALGVGGVGGLALRLASSYRWFSNVVFFGFVIFGAVCIAYAVIGRQAFSHFNAQPTSNLFTLGLGGGDFSKLQSSILPYATPGVLVALFGGPVLYLVGIWLMGRISRDWSPKRIRRIYATSFLGAILWLGLGLQLEKNTWFFAQDRYIYENPHWTMLRSSFPEFLQAKSPLLSIEYPEEDLKDFERPNLHAKDTGPLDPLVQKFHARPVKNVILLVLESVGSHYLTLYDNNSPVTPRLAEEAKNSVVFDSYYTPVGWTVYALNSILHATTPPLKGYTRTSFIVDNIPTPSLATVLRDRGYQTVFMASGDPQWPSKGIFDNGNFQLVRTELNLASPKRNSSWGVKDKYLFEDIRQFLDGRNKDSKPFFMFAWTDQTHHPYSLGSEEKNKAQDDFKRYLSILNEVDGYIGELLNYLREKKLADDTLVVITGDHGEAFRQIHNKFGHGYSVYDEEVKVPLILWNPRLIPNGYRVPTVGTHTDLAPTLLDLLGEPAPAEWQGSSLFAPNHPPRAYFFAAARGQYLLGVREDKWKYIIDARREEEELYDLEKDPIEQVNIAADHPERATRLRQRLAAMIKANENKYAWMSMH